MDPVTESLMNDFAQSINIDELPEDKKFEYFSAYSMVSSHTNDSFDTSDLVVGDGGDLNVDAFAVKVNGRLVDNADNVDDLLELNGYIEAEFIIVQSKTSSKFDGAALIALGDNLVNEVFSSTQTLPFNDDVKRLIEIKDRIYKNAARLKSNPVVRIFYVCTGNWTEDPYLTGVIKRKKQDLINLNLFSEVHFVPVGASSLQQSYRDTKTSISCELQFEKLITLSSISDVSASYLGVLPVSEFLKLITDNDGNILKSVFVDNVRDFQGENPVNVDIAKTIQDGLFDQFVLRNNGVTIVAKDIKVTSSNYTLIDYQIVNGCQTSHVIFSNKDSITGDLFIPIKLIHTESEDVSQSVIRSTNKQTSVDENDLLALTQFQRDLEDYYSGKAGDHALYYERRGKQYSARNDIEKGRVTSIGVQLKSFSSMFLQLPNQAGRYQGTLLKSVKSRVFKPGHSPAPYYTAAFAYYRFEVAIRRLPAEERVIRPFKFYLLLAFRHRFERDNFPGVSHKKVISYCDELNSELSDYETAKSCFDECVDIVKNALSAIGLPLERDNAKSRPLIDSVVDVARTRNPYLTEC